MSLLIVNVSADGGTQVREAISALTSHVPEHRVIDAADLRILPCRGCCHCMFVTPGRCCIRDDAEVLLKEIVAHDHIVFIMDTAFNYIDHKGKNVIDRMFALVNISIQFRDGEIVHIPRYDCTPKLAVLYTGDADRELINFWLSRAAINFNGYALGAAPVEEAAEVCRWIL